LKRSKAGKPPKNRTRVAEPVAVIGMAGRFPGARSIGEFWDNLMNGRETISHFSRRELEKAGEDPVRLRHPDYVRAKGILEDLEGFDAALFGYPPRDAEKMDPQLRLLHECAWEALEDAGYAPGRGDNRVGVFLGANENQEWLRRVKARESLTPCEIDGFLLSHRDYAATRIAYALDLKGPCFTLLSACSTSLVAVHLACQAIRGGECTMALAGGASITLPGKRGYFFQEGLMVSRSGHCRTFDARADGTVFGDGVGLVVLKAADKARADRDPVRALVLGSAVNNDGNGKAGFTAPSVFGQSDCIKAAVNAAGVESGSIGYIEAHGTGTRLGDPVELEALNRAFRARRNGRCWLGSVKSNIGHVNVAAGVCALIKTVLALENGRIPPSLHFKSPPADFPLAGSPFQVPVRPVDWEEDGRPRRAGVSAFGFGGTNAHLILEAGPRRRRGRKTRSRQLLVLSARSPEALEELSVRLAARLEARPRPFLADAAFTLSVGRRPFPYRRTIVARDSGEAAALLRQPGTVRNTDREDRDAVFLFPGQSAQYVDMGRTLYENEPAFRDALDECRRILMRDSGQDILRMLYPEASDREEASPGLSRTTIAQPALFSVSYAVARLLAEWGIRPAACIGHSIGEFTAACTAGVFTLEEALHIVARRGEFMQSLAPGAMLAVPLSEDAVQPWLSSEIDLAAVNAPGLCVLSGPTEAVESLRRRLREKGTAGRRLQTSHAFHSRMMDPVLDPFTRLFSGISPRPPKIPVLSTVTGEWAASGDLTRPEYWAGNLRRTVRFSAALTRLLRETDAALIEIGPGRTLSGLVRMHTDPEPDRAVVPTLPGAAESRDEVEFLLNAIGRLWQAGIPIDWPGFFRRQRRGRISLPPSPFERQRFWLDAAEPRENALRRLARLEKQPDMADWFAVPSWKRIPAPKIEPTGPENWLIFLDDTGLGERLARRLRQKRRRVITVRPGAGFGKTGRTGFIISPASKPDYDRLFEELTERDRLPRRIIHLWSVSGDQPRRLDPEGVNAAQESGFFSLLLLAQVIGSSGATDETRLLVVSDHVHEVTGDESIYPEKSTILGPIKVIPQEYPTIRCSGLDFAQVGCSGDPVETTAERVLAECLSGNEIRVAAWRGTHRWAQEYERLRLDRSFQKRRFLREGGVYLITGGLGGIGLVLAESLARAARAKLILTGRSSLPARVDWDGWLNSHDGRDPVSRKIRALRAVEKRGGTVHIIQADAADSPAMRRGIERAEKRFGPVNGIVHAAGVPGEGILQLKSIDAARRVLSPKLQGTLVLMDIFRGRALDFVVLCSSIAAVLGGIGLGDYCAANNFLDAFAAFSRARSTGPFISINWDMWGETGMGLKTEMPEELKGWFENELLSGITSREGVAALQRLLTWGGNGSVVVATRDLDARFDLWIRGRFIKEKESLLEEKADKPRYNRPHLTTPFDAPRTSTEKMVARIFGDLFGIEKVGRGDNFYELGGHSLLATTLLNRLRREGGAGISIRDVLDHPAVEDLAGLIDRAGEG